jgi:hypothetical protein
MKIGIELFVANFATVKFVAQRDRDDADGKGKRDP